ncbi:hypothetical protein CHLRE_02g142606v5 [Chlamydomonas reinhardtii]|uniref:Secreted protein n=1 Tax=Chlamydomonas reinhardtii TaxID=3055 RepID=A0A2K3E428_CHLRE|nr:uncharacterized protein CHLRE_02g142606v5 [Chlamydomonas reinhardtii]PNW87536.1 hypothetical protein CHLRE_02g142606v5 [Chlamydomonas reinhardtii]
MSQRPFLSALLQIFSVARVIAIQHCSATLPAHTFVHRRGFNLSLLGAVSGALWDGWLTSDRHYTSDIVLSNDGWLTATTPPTLCPATAQPCNTANKQAVEAQPRIRHGQQLVQH